MLDPPGLSAPLASYPSQSFSMLQLRSFNRGTTTSGKGAQQPWLRTLRVCKKRRALSSATLIQTSIWKGKKHQSKIWKIYFILFQGFPWCSHVFPVANLLNCLWSLCSQTLNKHHKQRLHLKSIDADLGRQKEVAAVSEINLWREKA